MMIEILKRGMIGVAFGGIYTFVALTIIKFNHIEVSISEVWTHMLASLILGIYFGLSSFIYENERWSPLKKTVIHFSLSIIVFFLIAIPIGWIPFQILSILLGILLFIIMYSLYWTGYYLYFKKMENDLNEQLQRKD